jgi:hypothetical protein
MMKIPKYGTGGAANGSRAIEICGRLMALLRKHLPLRVYGDKFTITLKSFSYKSGSKLMIDQIEIDRSDLRQLPPAGITETIYEYERHAIIAGLLKPLYKIMKEESPHVLITLVIGADIKDSGFKITVS